MPALPLAATTYPPYEPHRPHRGHRTEDSLVIRINIFGLILVILVLWQLYVGLPQVGRFVAWVTRPEPVSYATE